MPLPAQTCRAAIAQACLILGPVAWSLPAPAQEPERGGLPVAAPTDSPWWRAWPTGDAAGAPPTEWGEERNIAWRIDVPGRGHASPCVVGDQVFISTAIDDAEQIRLISYDRRTGEERWNRLLHEHGFMHTHLKNSHASGTPACDGERIFVAHMLSQDGVDGVYLSAVALDGTVLWQKLAGPYVTQHGYAPSPVFYGDSVIVVGDSGHEDAFVAAFDRQSGDEVWRARRQGIRNFGCPTVAFVAGRDQLVIPGGGETVSYDPHTGHMLWRVDGPSSSAANTVAVDDSMVFSSGGWPEKNVLAIRADGSGDVTNSHIAWRRSKAVCYVPTMLVHDRMLFAVSDNGIATCYDRQSGEPLWEKRLGGNFSASPVLAGGRIFIPDEEGEVHVFHAGDKYEPIAKNHLHDGGFATPVVLGGKIYLRTVSRLYCIAQDS